MSKLFIGALLGLGLLGVGGCTEVIDDGKTRLAVMAWWAPVLGTVICIAILIASFALRKSLRGFVWFMYLFVPFFWVMVIPGVFTDYAKVDGEHVECKYGFWISPTKYNIQFKDLASITIVLYSERSRGNVKTVEKLEFKPRLGDAMTMHLGDVTKLIRDEIIENAERAGVTILKSDQRN